MYLNQEYVFTAAPPLVPADYNPVGSYLRVVELPEAWFAEKLEVFLTVGAAASAYYVWVNGELLGYAEDSKLASEFRIPPRVLAGKRSAVIALKARARSEAVGCRWVTSRFWCSRGRRLGLFERGRN